ncbi:hypothetical protein ACWOFR_12480 [Carnobacterium gallinarum]|uniref:hypothetical protein n=1 Tax=Carnobacterium gallinarum TaxID=2749 RepID=UPI000555C70C|nr:hypothetical protein [Carnobacterium gallinarum]
MTAELNGNYPFGYSVEISNKSDKMDEGLTHEEFGFNLLSNFLIDAGITDKPLNMIIKYSSKGRNEYVLTDNLTLTSIKQPEDKGVIIQLARTIKTN